MREGHLTETQWPKGRTNFSPSINQCSLDHNISQRRDAGQTCLTTTKKMFRTREPVFYTSQQKGCVRLRESQWDWSKAQGQEKQPSEDAYLSQVNQNGANMVLICRYGKWGGMLVTGRVDTRHPPASLLLLTTKFCIITRKMPHDSGQLTAVRS